MLQLQALQFQAQFVSEGGEGDRTPPPPLWGPTFLPSAPLLVRNVVCPSCPPLPAPFPRPVRLPDQHRAPASSAAHGVPSGRSIQALPTPSPRTLGRRPLHRAIPQPPSIPIRALGPPPRHGHRRHCPPSGAAGLLHLRPSSLVESAVQAPRIRGDVGLSLTLSVATQRQGRRPIRPLVLAVRLPLYVGS
ncbi:hypothetical protein BS78_06G247400 [Paspalum vaginatum]|nr:hypothetical protein BS78_06G247400 [Paspalum vaginatum]